jgi:hypothetical protein
MRRILLSFFTIITLLAAPAVHAAGMACEEIGCEMEMQPIEQHTSIQQDHANTDGSGKSSQDMHQCHCAHVSAMRTEAVMLPVLLAQSSATPLISGSSAHMAPITIGSPIKPPSHA